MAAPEFCRRSLSGTATVKQESVETDPLASPKREMEDADVKGETLFLYEWEPSDGLSSAQDPLSIKKEEPEAEEKAGSLCDMLYIKTEPECSPSEHFPGPSSLNIGKMEDEEDDEEALSGDNREECSSSEEFLRPSTLNIEKTEDEEDKEEAISDDDRQELTNEMVSTSSGCAPQSGRDAMLQRDPSRAAQPSVGGKQRPGTQLVPRATRPRSALPLLR